MRTAPSDDDVEAYDGSNSTPGNRETFEDETERIINNSNNNKNSNSAEDSRSASVNADFKDVEETGKWGTVTKKELFIVISLVAIILIGGIVGITVWIVHDNGSSSSNNNKSNDDGAMEAVPSPAPVASRPTFASADDKWKALADAIKANPAVSIDQALLFGPLVADDDFVATSDNLWTDVTQPAEVRATSWILHKDGESDYVEDLIPRFVLATLFFTHNGMQWNDSTNWMTAAHVCDWYGTDCSLANKIIEVDLSENNLSGELSSVMALLNDCTAYLLNGNAITGPIPGPALGSMPALSILSLQNNQLTGPIPPELRDSGSLDTLYVFGNNLEGTWPDAFCPMCETCPPPFREFGLDCDQTPCNCCLQILNCFNS